MDVVHMSYPGCPAALKTVYEGMEKEPTLAFNVHIDAQGRKRAIARVAPVAKNDMTIIRADRFAMKVLEDPNFTEYTYKIFRESGAEEMMQGL